MDNENSTFDLREEPSPELKAIPSNTANYSPQPEKKSGCAKVFLGVMIGFASVILLFIALGWAFIAAMGSLVETFGDFETVASSSSGFETTVLRHGSGPRIAVVDVRGIIARGKISGGTDSIKMSELLAKLDGYDAVILDMDTPGGEVIAADEIYGALMKLRNKHENLKIVTCMHSLAASGGYYIAMASDYIVANRMTITGSIGVIMSTYNVTGLMGKIGVEAMVFRSGEMKDMLSMTRTVTDGERAYMNRLIGNTFHEFASIVAAGRPAYETAADVKNAPFGDGRVMSGADALEYKLVDELGDFDAAVAAAARLVKGEEAEGEHEPHVERVTPGMKFWDTLMEMSGNMSWQSRLIPGNGAVMKPGQLYYMLPSAAL